MKKIVFFIFLISVFSCHLKKKGNNYPVIPEERFINLLVDYHLAEGVSNSEYYRLKTKNRKYMNVNDSVLKSYGYSRALFDSSISFYSGDPDKYDQIYDKVIARLNRMEAEIEQKMAKKASLERKKLEKAQAEEKKQKEKIQSEEKKNSSKQQEEKSKILQIKQLESKQKTLNNPVKPVKTK
jgi:hypothetical protein